MTNPILTIENLEIGKCAKLHLLSIFISARNSVIQEVTNVVRIQSWSNSNDLMYFELYISMFITDVKTTHNTVIILSISKIFLIFTGYRLNFILSH